VHSSVYCLPADLLGEGADRVVGTVRDRAGVSGVTVAASYHATRDIYPHNPACRVASLAPGAFYAVDPSAYPGPLRPAASPSGAGRDILAEACRAAAPLGVQVSAWAVLLHRDDRRPQRTAARNAASTPGGTPPASHVPRTTGPSYLPRQPYPPSPATLARLGVVAPHPR